MEEKIETIRMTLQDAEKLGITWTDICDITDGNIYAINEGQLDKEDFVNVPISLIKNNH